MIPITVHSQGNLLKRRVNFIINEQPLENVLLELSNKAHFTFSYDASLFTGKEKVSISAYDESVKNSLDKMLPGNIVYKVSGNHLILLKKPTDKGTQKKEKYTISGQVFNAKTGEPLKSIMVYEVSSLVSSITDEKGQFEMEVPIQFEQFGLSFSQKAVRDTVIIIPPHDQKLNISLVTLQEVSRIKNIGISYQQTTPLESLYLVQQLVSDQSLLRTQSTNLVLRKIAQVSLLPAMGTNLKMNGLVRNDLSLNIFIGYSYGVDAFELGGLFNTIRQDVNGVQIGGLGNLVGGDTRGFQLAGIFNHNRGSLNGIQIGGISNMLIDSLRGVQFAGISNILKGKMNGWQIAGINNLTTGDVDGIQFAGITNVALKDVQRLQIAGIVNTGKKNIRGVQIAGIANVAQGDVRGIQFAGIINRAGNVSSSQLAGIGNIAIDTVFGAQIGGIFNYAKYIKGTQLGLLNFSDSTSGTPVGLLSFVKKGMHKVEFSTNGVTATNFALKFGVKRFYNIFTGGYSSWAGPDKRSFGYGFGTQKDLSEKIFMNVEYTANWVNESDGWQKDLSLLNRFNINFGYGKSTGLAFSAGPSLNVWLSEWRDEQSGTYLTELAPYTLTEGNIGSTQYQVWIGGKVAIQF